MASLRPKLSLITFPQAPFVHNSIRPSTVLAPLGPTSLISPSEQLPIKEEGRERERVL